MTLIGIVLGIAWVAAMVWLACLYGLSSYDAKILVVALLLAALILGWM